MDHLPNNLSCWEVDEAVIIKVVRLGAKLLFKHDQTSRQKPLRRRPPLKRDRVGAHNRLMQDYFIERPLYDHVMFRRRFRMSRQLFLRITGDLEREFPYFQQREDANHKLGFSPIQKCTSAIRQLAYGTSQDSWDEYLKMSEKASRDSFQNFCEGIIDLYAKRYLRSPSFSDIQKIYEVHQEVHGFPGMLGSIDCTHWDWASCPTAWRGQHHRVDHDGPSLILEAVASYDLWIWHAFFGVAGANNDITVIEQSPVFDDIIDGVAPGSSFYANDVEYKYGYYLTDGIYPEWATLVKAFSCPSEEKRIHFKKRQESAREDIERAFGVLKKRWSIIAQPARIWMKERLRNIMYTCIILHNMILEDLGKAICQEYDDNIQPVTALLSAEEKRANLQNIKNRDTHGNLRADLVEHIWNNQIIDDNDDGSNDEENDDYYD